MDTTRATELLEHFKMHGISHDPKKGLDLVLEYQDVIGHTAQGDIRAYWDTLDAIQKTDFLWVNFQTLGQDSALHIVRLTAVQEQFDCWQDQHEKHTQEERAALDEELADLRSCQKAINKRLHDLRTRAEYAELRLRNQRSLTKQAEAETQEARDRMEALAKQNYKLREAARRYYVVREALTGKF